MIRDIQLFIKGTEQACGFAPKGTQNLQPSETGSVDVFFFYVCYTSFVVTKHFQHTLFYTLGLYTVMISRRLLHFVICNLQAMN